MAEAVLSARFDQATLSLVPASIGVGDWVEDCGLSRRIESLGVKPIRTVWLVAVVEPV